MTEPSTSKNRIETCISFNSHTIEILTEPSTSKNRIETPILWIHRQNLVSQNPVPARIGLRPWSIGHEMCSYLTWTEPSTSKNRIETLIHWPRNVPLFDLDRTQYQPE